MRRQLQALVRLRRLGDGLLGGSVNCEAQAPRVLWTRSPRAPQNAAQFRLIGCGIDMLDDEAPEGRIRGN